MKFLNYFKKTKNKAEEGRFARVLLGATEKERELMFNRAAQKANEEQRATLAKSQLRVKTN